MQRCDYCGRSVYKNVSGTYVLCSSKCKKKHKDRIYMSDLEQKILSLMADGITVTEIDLIVEDDKFDIVSAVRRLVYFDKILFKKTKTEINLLTRIFTKRK